MIGYMSFAEMSEKVRAGACSLPSDIDLIVGIPRSGMIPAYLLGLYRNVGVIDLPSFLAGQKPEHGARSLRAGEGVDDKASSILLVDDSVYSGSAIRKALARIVSSGFSGKITTCAVVVEPSQCDSVDLHFSTMPFPRFFEWNAFHHQYIIESSCMDMDGVLCVDPLPEQNDDGPRYRHFLETAAVKCRPTGRIGSIVSARLEKYRDLTAWWLRRNHIEYGRLHLLDVAAARERRRLNAHAAFKAQIYANTGSFIFFESDPHQAVDIARLANKPVLCVESMKMHYPALYSWPVRDVLKWKLSTPIARIKAFRRRLAVSQ